MGKNIYRYKFSTEFSNNINEFCKNNNHLNNSDFKLKFKEWKMHNAQLIKNEEIYLKSLGYIGDFDLKITKSIIHYFKKKNFQDNDLATINRKQENHNRNYITLDYEFLLNIDNYIKRIISESDNLIIKPSLLFDHFKLIYKSDIEDQIKKLNLIYEDSVECHSKIKKTFQNRYYNINK